MFSQLDFGHSIAVPFIEHFMCSSSCAWTPGFYSNLWQPAGAFQAKSEPSFLVDTCSSSLGLQVMAGPW